MRELNMIKTVPWHLRHNDEIWTTEEVSNYVATVENPEYPDNSALGEYIVAIHNAQIDKVDNALAAVHFDYEKFVGELREAP